MYYIINFWFLWDSHAVEKKYIINKQEVDWNQLFQFSKIKGFCYSFTERRSHGLTF